MDLLSDGAEMKREFCVENGFDYEATLLSKNGYLVYLYDFRGGSVGSKVEFFNSRVKRIDIQDWLRKMAQSY